MVWDSGCGYINVVHRGTRRPGIVAWLYLDQYDDQQGQRDTVKLQTKYEHN